MDQLKFRAQEDSRHAEQSHSPQFRKTRSPLPVWSSLLGIVGLLALPTSEAGAAWPQFRGANGSGIAENAKPPLRFGPGTNEIFRVQVPAGASSPCVWGDRIFLTAFEDGKLETLCLARKEGKVLWKQVAPAETIETFHPTEGSPAASTPACDGERVYVYFGSCGLLCYDFEGKEVWRVPMPPAQHVGEFGTGTSPIVHGDTVVLNRDMLLGSFVLAVNAKDGKPLWRQERPEFFSSYSTPIVWEHDGAAEVVVAGVVQMKGYDLKTGAESWSVNGLPSAACTTPVLGDGLLFYAGWSPSQKDMPMPLFPDVLQKLDSDKDGALQKPEVANDPMINILFSFLDENRDGKVTSAEWEGRVKTFSRGENSAMAVRPGKGDLTRSNVVWKQSRGLPYVPSPLFYQGSVYLVKDGGMVSCFDAKSGQTRYLQERVGTTSGYYASPVGADGHLFIVGLDGNVTIFKAGEKPEVISRCSLGERCVTTPAIVDDTIYFRTSTQLWAFRNPAI